MIGVYVTAKQGDKVSGVTIHRVSGRVVTRKFTRCTLSRVLENARLVIHEPTVFICTGRIGSGQL